MRSLAALGKPAGHYWDSIASPTLPSWLTLAPDADGSAGATYTNQDPATTAGGVILRPASRDGAQSWVNLPKVTVSQYRAVRLRAIFTPTTNLSNIVLRIGQESEQGGARLLSRRYPNLATPKLGATSPAGTNYLDSRMNRVDLDKTHDWSVLIDNSGSRRVIYTLQGDDIVERWIPGDLMSLTNSITPGFALSQFAGANPIDARVILREISFERWR
jgi:hypothetical protein